MAVLLGGYTVSGKFNESVKFWDVSNVPRLTELSNMSKISEKTAIKFDCENYLR